MELIGLALSQDILEFADGSTPFSVEFAFTVAVGIVTK